MEVVFVLDATGRSVDARLLVASEWVGIATSGDGDSSRIRFVPGGIAHALDPAGNVVLCGADPARLEPFALDFDTDEWSFRCPECRRRARSVGT